MNSDGMAMNNKCMMMGDLVLKDEEVSKVFAQLVASGLEITAEHNHLVNETPAIKVYPLLCEGSAEELAQKISQYLLSPARR
jgi:hypothetical protein